LFYGEAFTVADIVEKMNGKTAVLGERTSASALPLWRVLAAVTGLDDVRRSVMLHQGFAVVAALLAIAMLAGVVRQTGPE